jgi:lipopolysaccharide transport system permease protein
MKKNSISPVFLVKSVFLNRSLIRSLVRREIESRYKGSSFGLFWSFINPVLLLAVYTFVFTSIFKVNWIPAANSKTEFALILFAGLIVFNLFSECLNRAPSLIVSNPNYVKKVIFPLEILPWVGFGSAFFHFGVSLFVWLIFFIGSFGIPHWTIVLIPLLILPVAFLSVGFGWILSSLGTYLRDIAQVVSLATMALMFMSPVFFPSSAVPPEYQTLLALNPLKFLIESMRGILVWGQLPNWSSYLTSLFTCALFAAVGFAWFQKTRNGFADVI